MKEIKENFSKLINVKSIITLSVILSLEIAVLFTLFFESESFEKIFTLFSNVVTMVITYFFTKKKEENQ